jgi:hypothetical protein
MDGGSITLKNLTTMVVDAGYKQTGGAFTTDGSSLCDLYLNVGNRVAEFDGGTLSPGGTGFGGLKIDTQDGGGTTDKVNLHGVELDVNIKGNDRTMKSQLYCPNGTVDIGMTSKLVVKAVGAVQKNLTWYVILAKSIPNDFAMANKDFTAATGVTSSGPSADGTSYKLGS